MREHVQSRIARCVVVAGAFWVEGATAYAQNPVIDLQNGPPAISSPLSCMISHKETSGTRGSTRYP